MWAGHEFHLRHSTLHLLWWYGWTRRKVTTPRARRGTRDAPCPAVPIALNRGVVMEVQKEAQRIMTLSVWKMYHSRMQRGGLRLHRSLQLSLVMRSARELYLSAKVEAHEPEASFQPAHSSDPLLNPPREAGAGALDGEQPSLEPIDTQEAPRAEEVSGCGAPRPAKGNRKRRSSSLSDGGDVGLVPNKKARLEEEEEVEGVSSEVPDRLQPSPAQAEGAFPNLARVLQRRFSDLLNCNPVAPPTAPPACEAKTACRPADNLLNVLVRAVVAF
ncbi:immediate early response gene 2 protein isoform X3 [Nycticebus coucang]|nr:immediate early response gene 2 protein isoform X3 [Nycticebus coucang]XP_053442294.1 immediate early response gene 2 protein isoform X3 [Nycticebus coucang]